MRSQIRPTSEVSYVLAAVMQEGQRRDLARVLSRVLFEAEQMGEDYFYVLEELDEHGVPVEGCTIAGAAMLARNWGNCASTVRLISDDGMHWLVEGAFLDMELGVTHTRLHRHRKVGLDDRLTDASFQVAQSKALRKAILAGVPSWLEKQARRKAQGASRSTTSPAATSAPPQVNAPSEVHAPAVGAVGALLAEGVDLMRMLRDASFAAKPLATEEFFDVKPEASPRGTSLRGAAAQPEEKDEP